MPPKVQNARGTSRKVAAAEEAPIASPTKKRGRPAKDDSDGATKDTAKTPRKRGRPAKATTEDASESTKRGRGRKSDAPTLAAPAVTPKKASGKPEKDTGNVEEPSTARRGRPRKEVVAETAQTAQTPRGRGRPPKTQGLDQDRVAGSARVSKRSSAPSKKPAPAATAARVNPRVRSKLRTRLPPAKVTKEEPAPQSARRGRPPKSPAQAPATKKPASRKAAETPASKPTKPSKPTVPRKMRGHTLRQIPDKFIAQVDQFLHDLMQADSNLPPVEQEQGQGHNVESDADVGGDKNMEPTSALTGNQDQEAAEDAGTELAHAQNDGVNQYLDGAPNDLEQSETAVDESREPEQDMQSELNEEVTAHPNDVDEDGIIVPAEEIDMPIVDYENTSDGAQGLLPTQDQERYPHENLVASSTSVAA